MNICPAKAPRRKVRPPEAEGLAITPWRLGGGKPLVLLLLLPLTIAAQTPNRKLAAEVKAEFLHAWNGYKKYAWGHDDLKPLSKTYHDWYPQPLLMTPVDSLD